LIFAFYFFGFLVIAKLFYWQLIQGGKLSSLALSQYSREEEIPAPRGQILTSDGFPLVANREVYLLYAILTELDKKAGEVAEKIAGVLGRDIKEQIEKRLSSENVIWVPLAHGVDREKKEKIQALNLPGIGFEEEARRDYPEGSMAAHLLGFVGKDAAGRDKGYFGLEGFYNRELQGRPGVLREERDPQGRPILIGKRYEEGEVPGRDLELYLKRDIQFMVEEKLKDGIRRYGAKAGSVTLMDPKTGGILAMASFPSYDPSDFVNFGKELFPNPVVAESFEPGSIFKVLVMAAAINEKVVSPGDRCPKCGGPVKIGEYTIKTWDEKYRQNETMSEIIQHSDNVGMAYVAEKLGVQKMVSYLKKFGIGERTGIDLEEETTPALREEKDWVPIDLATAGFGQGVAVTPIQMVRAVGAIANGGKLVKPLVVRKIKSGGQEIEIKPEVEREVISETTAKIITEMMVNAVEKGEARWAKPKGYRIAGKTGTAQIPIAGHYDKEKTIASFIGFAPADNPRFVMLVTLREPTSSPWGSETAAPLWFEIAKEIFIRWGIVPD